MAAASPWRKLLEPHVTDKDNATQRLLAPVCKLICLSVPMHPCPCGF
jgi:hypothetical protein